MCRSERDTFRETNSSSHTWSTLVKGQSNFSALCILVAVADPGGYCRQVQIYMGAPIGVVEIHLRAKLPSPTLPSPLLFAPPLVSGLVDSMFKSWYWFQPKALLAKKPNYFKIVMYLGRKELFYFTTHSARFIYGYMRSKLYI